MGLALWAYSQLKLVDAKYDEETGDFITQSGEILKKAICCLYPNSDFPNHTHLTEVSGLLKENNQFNRVAIGSYMYYTCWRNAIATLFGNNSGELSWLDVEDAPFNELLNFTDCDGIITGKYLVKIQKDFNSYMDLAKSKLKLGDFDTYCKIKEIFDSAAPNGVVIFC